MECPGTVVWGGALMSGLLHSVVKQTGVLRGFSTETEAEATRRTAVTSFKVDSTPGDVASKVTK